MTPPSAEVLLLTSIYDFPSDRICVELNALGASYARINAESLASSRLRLDPVAPRLEVWTDNAYWVIDASLRSVWWRQPTFHRNATGGPRSLDEQLQHTQWPAFLRALTLFEEARWINSPAATYQAEMKPWQLRRASRLGFDTPRTLITNDPAAPVDEILGEVVAAKSVDTVLLREGDHQIFAYTQILPWRDCANEQLQQAPLLLQEAIVDKLDLRVTVLGENIWCVAIESVGKGIEGDWRLHPKENLAYRTVTLPTDITRRCVALVRDMGLTYGAIDLVAHDSRYVFIEINPTGEWGWLDTHDRPLAKAIAAELTK